jgi:hypothetical protein
MNIESNMENGSPQTTIRIKPKALVMLEEVVFLVAKGLFKGLLSS